MAGKDETTKIWLPAGDEEIAVSVNSGVVAFSQSMQMSLQPMSDKAGFQVKPGKENQ